MPPRQIHIDAARVLASHPIVLHHFTAYGPLAHALDLTLPGVIDWFFGYARMAGQVFLVIEGYLAIGTLEPHGYAGGFGTDLMLKDLGLAQENAGGVRGATPLGGLARSLYAALSLAGNAGEDFSSAICLLQKASRLQHVAMKLLSFV